MVIVKLSGGLANQMFPYAAGRRLAWHLGTELKLDVSAFSAYRQPYSVDFRQYVLGVFNIVENFATPEEILELTVRGKTLLEKLLGRSAGRPGSFVREKHFHFDQSILHLRGDIYLAGNWNNPGYFSDAEQVIRQEFTWRQPPDGMNLTVLGNIARGNSVSIHVRRGDYVENPKVRAVHGYCDLDYFQRAARYVARLVENPHFFVFSDDPGWVRQHLTLQWPMTIVEHNDAMHGHEDMRLMKSCKHNIIANSGFSWWAAWLNDSPDKIVVAPKRWFSTSKYDDRGLMPPGWVRL